MTRLTIEYDIKGKFLEPIANASILPGMLLQLDNEGKVGPHNSLDGYTSPLIAVENKLAGKSIFEPYETASMVHCRYCLPGDVFMGVVGDASIKKNVFVSSAGNGKLKKIPSGILLDTVIVGQAIAVGEEIYSYFAINGLSLEEVYAQAAGFYYGLDKGKIGLDDFMAVEVV